MEIGAPRQGDLDAVMTLAGHVLSAERAGPFIRSHLERHHLLIAREGDDVLGVVGYRTDWFQCTFVGFHPSGYIDNLPQGYGELLFYKRLV